MINEYQHCLCCGTYNVEILMLKDEVWKQINPDVDGWLCVSCMEDKLGREITSKDLDVQTYLDYAESRNKRFEKIKSYQVHEVAKYMLEHFPALYNQIKKMMENK